MKIFQNISEARNIKNPVLTLGVYDGIHIGHQAIIEQLNRVAKKVGGESVLLTFEPHPRITLDKGADSLQLLTLLDEKTELLRELGLQNLIVHPFTKEFSQLSADDFVKLLINKIGIHSIIIGYDHHFGKDRSGNFEELNKLSKVYNFDCIKVEEIKSENHHISSTQIRNALLDGDVELAQKGLNRNFCLYGEVVNGDKIGRTLGFPTANLKVPKFKLIPGNGVYIVKVKLGDDIFKGLLSIGTRPTVSDSGDKRVEVFILNFEKDIYGEKITLEIFRKIRNDQKFNSIEALISQMNTDKIIADEFEFN